MSSYCHWSCCRWHHSQSEGRKFKQGRQCRSVTDYVNQPWRFKRVLDGRTLLLIRNTVSKHPIQGNELRVSNGDGRPLNTGSSSADIGTEMQNSFCWPQPTRSASAWLSTSGSPSGSCHFFAYRRCCCFLDIRQPRKPDDDNWRTGPLSLMSHSDFGQNTGGGGLASNPRHR